MTSLTNVAVLLALLISLLTNASTVLACGTIPPGQARSRSFNVTGFSLPVAMVYSGVANVPARVPGIATSERGARAFVSRLIMQAVLKKFVLEVFDVLEQQGRSAGLSDAIIAIILGQLTVQVNYTPLQCMQVTVDQAANVQFPRGMMLPHCIILGNTVTSLCVEGNDDMCQIDTNMNIGAIPTTHLTISGTLSTTNIIMANWSTAMWQGVVNRAVRMLASGPFGANFFSAFAIVS